MDNSRRIDTTLQPSANYIEQKPARRMSAVKVLACAIFEAAVFYASYYIYKNWKWPYAQVSIGILAVNTLLVTFTYLKVMRKQSPQQSSHTPLSAQPRGQQQKKSSSIEKNTTVKEIEKKESEEHRQKIEKYEALLLEISTKSRDIEKIEELSKLLTEGFLPDPTDKRALDVIKNCWNHNEIYLSKCNRRELPKKIDPKKLSLIKERNTFLRKVLDTVGNKYLQEAYRLQSAGQQEKVQQLNQLSQSWLDLSIPS